MAFQPRIFKPDWRPPRLPYFTSCRDKPVPKSAVVVQMQAKGDMDSETFWPSFCHLFCIYFSKFLAPLLHLIFDAKLHFLPHFGELFGAFLAPWGPPGRLWPHGCQNRGMCRARGVHFGAFGWPLGRLGAPFELPLGRFGLHL